MKFKLGRADSVFRVEISEEISKSEILEAARSIAGDRNYQTSVGVLVVLLDVHWKLMGAEIHHLATMHRLRPIRWAAVTQEPLSYGISRQFAALAEDGAKLRVFRTEQDALIWILKTSTAD